jgi:aminoglycoside 6'-N-acetyltransferase I
MRIEDLATADADAQAQVAKLLVAGFAAHWPRAWPDQAAALDEVRASLGGERISRVAREEHGTIVGWIGGMPEYDGNVWELHPLVVRLERQGQGIGRALVRDFERQVSARGGLTIMLGTDDEDGMTSLAGVELYPNVWEPIARIQNLRRHPYEFYQKLGFVITGVVPDANGRGKPDILMAKAVRPPQP